MNYKRIYDALIDRAKGRIVCCYVETHHIIPRCMGGTDDHENLVDLTPEEHFLAHQLLAKIHPENSKLVFAAVAMTRHNSSSRISNKMYGWIRRRHAEAVSKQFRDHWADPEKRNSHVASMLAAFNTTEHRERRSKNTKSRWDRDDGTMLDQIRQLQAEYNSKLAERNKELWQSQEYKEKMKIARSGIVWWTNGKETVKSRTQPGPDFYRGRANPNLGRKKNEANCD